jgi:C4-dicarboxylate-specific signal transduction histidine kinase
VFSISYNAPLFGPDRSLQGVVGVDMVLSQLSTWLQGVWQNRKGMALIVEPNGDLVASSLPELTLTKQGGNVERANLRELSTPLIHALRQAFQAATRQPDQPSPWGQAEGLNWTLLTALAASPSNAAAERSSTLALVAAAAALSGAVVLIGRQIRALLEPLAQLESASRELSSALSAPSATAAPNLHFQSGLSSASGEELIALDGAISELVERYNALTANLQEAQERERFRDAQTLALLKDKLRSSLQAAAVAHEINQPLSVLLLNSQLLLERSQQLGSPELPESWQAQLRSIRQEADRVVLTIEKMRALLRNVQTEHQRLDLREVAQSALLYARSGGPLSRLTVDSTELDQQREAAWVDGDAVQIQIAFVNLLRNAAEALSNHSTDAPWIGISLQPEGEQWCLSVSDNGPGLPPQALDSTPLQTTKATGSGLGLFVVRTTMDNHHGELRCASSPQGGASLALLFPAQAAPLPTTGD